MTNFELSPHDLPDLNEQAKIESQQQCYQYSNMVYSTLNENYGFPSNEYLSQQSDLFYPYYDNIQTISNENQLSVLSSSSSSSLSSMCHSLNSNYNQFVQNHNFNSDFSLSEFTSIEPFFYSIDYGILRTP